jgi:hypothetical protein
MSNNPLEPYLNALEQSLQMLPKAERQEWREEARQHLLDIARAHEELGQTPEEALTVAMQQFGNPTQIGRQMAHCTDSAPLKWKTAITLFSVPLMMSMVLLIGLAYAYVLTDSPPLLGCLQLGGVIAFITAPILGGWRVGKRMHPDQSPTPIFLALTLILLLFLPVASVLLVPALGVSPERAITLCWGVLWLPMTCLTLFLTRRRSAHKPSIA